MSELPIVLLLLLAVAVLLRMDLVFYLVYVLAGTYALARWWAGHNLKRLQLRRRFTDHIFLDETVGVEIELATGVGGLSPGYSTRRHRLSRWAPAMRCARSWRCGPKEQVRLSYTLVGQQRGYYQIGPGILNTGDLFGFADTRGTFDEPQHLTVYPRVIPLTHVELISALAPRHDQEPPAHLC